MKKVLVLALVFGFMFCLVNTAEAKAKAVAEWTFMCFLNADNNLDEFGVQDMDEMKKVGSTDKVNIIALVDRANGPAQLMYMEKGNAKILKEMGEIDMGDYKVMLNFVKFCKENYPANHYILDIWNHGAGWKLKGDQVMKGISYDDQSGNNITTPQLKIACAEIKKILGQNLDIMSHDACLMAMLEICAEQYETVDYFLASEETEPGDGYAYDLMLGPIVKNPGMSVKEALVALVKGFGQYYATTAGTTTSGLDMSKIAGIIVKTEALADAMVAGLTTPANKTAMKAVMTSVQKFYYRDNVDLIHLCELMAAKINDEGIKKAATELAAAVKESVIENFRMGANMANAKGMAIYMPTTGMSSAYTAIALGKTKWVNAIKAVKGCYTASKNVEETFAYNLEYPTIAAQAISLEAKRGNFTNFDTLLTLTSDNAEIVKTELKKTLGAEVLNGNEQLKGKVDQLLK